LLNAHQHTLLTPCLMLCVLFIFSTLMQLKAPPAPVAFDPIKRIGPGDGLLTQRRGVVGAAVGGG
jgi:hypothetical protein